MQTDRIPDEIMWEAFAVADKFYKSDTGHKRNLTLHIARALMARDKRAAEIARKAGDTWSGSGDYMVAVQEAAVDDKCEENRTAQEVFDIMCDRFRRALSPSPVVVTFEQWWKASKYRQVIYAGASEQQIARDGWDAALASLSQPAKGEREGGE